MNLAVRARSLEKNYDVYDRPADRLLELLTFRPRHRTFPALRDVSFEIARGESVGLIGENGAGKSTLLKLVSGVARPSGGDLEVSGSVASILELGTGFHPEFSGRDNAALNAAILGLSPREIAKALPRIFAFSELGVFLDRPVRTYSSGMYMRLAFSVAVSVDPEVLIIDEALAVGDGYFQKKCIDRIREFQHSGRTIVFCSHALYLVTTLCRRALWLDRGRLMNDGAAVDVVHAYETHLMEKNRASRPEGAIDDQVVFSDVAVGEGRGDRVESLESGAPLVVRARVDATRAERPARVRIAIVRAADETRCCAVTMPDTIDAGSGAREISVRFSSLPLTRGDYGVVLTAESSDGNVLSGRLAVRPAFRIRGDRFEVGLMRMHHDWMVKGPVS